MPLVMQIGREIKMIIRQHLPMSHSRVVILSLGNHSNKRQWHDRLLKQNIDRLTKPLSRQRHQELRFKIGVADGTPILRGRVNQLNSISSPT
jgi:hypothetical protein